jgi:hypothetical protein
MIFISEDNRLTSQFWIDRGGRSHYYEGDGRTVSVHYDIAKRLRPEDDFPVDTLTDLGWIRTNVIKYNAPIIHKEPSQAQINALFDLGLYYDLLILNGGRYVNYYRLAKQNNW